MFCACCNSCKIMPVVVHGAGSFGHFEAKYEYFFLCSCIKVCRKYGIATGCTDLSCFPHIGFAATQESVRRLSTHVVNALLREGLPALRLPVFPEWCVHPRKQVCSH